LDFHVQFFNTITNMEMHAVFSKFQVAFSKFQVKFLDNSFLKIPGQFFSKKSLMSTSPLRGQESHGKSRLAVNLVIGEDT
jgi:hypothetical protein